MHVQVIVKYKDTPPQVVISISSSGAPGGTAQADCES